MTTAIPGHGYRDSMIVTPRCKCGWYGTTFRGSSAAQEARSEYERHKAVLRATESRSEAPGPVRARQRAITGPRPKLTLIGGTG